MNKYERIPEKVIDLHGHSVRKSEALLEEILHSEEVSHLRIIVGKGTPSEKGAVLREFVKEFLRERNVRFSQSKIRDGGEGALEVFLS